MHRRFDIPPAPSRIRGARLQYVNYRDLLNFRVLLADQVDALLPQDCLEDVQPRIATGLHRDSLGGLAIAELAPRLAVAQDLLRLSGQGRRPITVHLALPAFDQVRPADRHFLALHGADRHTVVFRGQDLAIYSTPQDDRLPRLGDRARLGQARQRHAGIAPCRLIYGGWVTRIYVIHIGVLQGSDRHPVLARPDGRAALLQTEIPLLGIHEERVLAVDVRPAYERCSLECQVVLHD